MKATTKPIQAGILGGSGYTGAELLRLLVRHPNATPRCITSRAQAGQRVTELFPFLRGSIDLEFTTPEQSMLSECDVVFCAAPNGVAMTHAEELLKAKVKVIDLSADFRIRDAGLWEKWYGQKHSCPALLEQAVYGLPEVNRQSIQAANLVANPGCYPTAVQLGYLPLIENDLIELDHLIADVKSGVSGAGRKANLANNLAELSDSFKAYGVPGHRHQPEIQQQLELLTKQPVDLVFTPHLLPIIRGIHATLYGKLKKTDVDLQQLYQQRFAEEPFVDVLPAGSHPDTRSVRGANTCRVAVHRPQDGANVVVLVVEDNLVKGAAGQAIQNMNLMFGLSETAGLDDVALVP